MEWEKTLEAVKAEQEKGYWDMLRNICLEQKDEPDAKQLNVAFGKASYLRRDLAADIKGVMRYKRRGRYGEYSP